MWVLITFFLRSVLQALLWTFSDHNDVMWPPSFVGFYHTLFIPHRLQEFFFLALLPLDPPSHPPNASHPRADSLLPLNRQLETQQFNPALALIDTLLRSLAPYLLSPELRDTFFHCSKQP
jgi:hypothetical protein